jgi:sulfur relay (sulfurtransferase) complex TusBCD TusD component (DsrE family)
MDLSRRKLGLLISTHPEHPNLDTALGLSRAALDRGVDLYIYLIDDAVRAKDRAEVQELARRGAKLFVCAYGCQKRNVPLSEPDRFNYCGLVVLTDLLNGCERFLALN